MLTTSLSSVTYNGSGSAGPFDIPFTFPEVADITVVKLVSTTETTLTNVTDYTVTGAGYFVSGGTLTLTTALLAGEMLTITREVSATQPTKFRDLGAFFPSIHEQALDRIMMVVQQQNGEYTRGLRLPLSSNADTEIPALTPGAILAVNAAGDGFEFLTDAPSYVSTTVSASSYGTDIADAITAIGSSSITLVIDSPITVNDNATTHVNTHMVVRKPGMLTVANGKTLTTNGPFSAGTYQVFDGAGSIVFGGNVVNPNGWFTAGQIVTFNAGLSALPSLISTGMVLGSTAKVSEAYPEWYISNANPGTTNTTAAINTAISQVNTLGGGKVTTKLEQLITTPILMKSGVQLEINNTLTCSGMTAQGGTEITNTAVLFVGTSVGTYALTVAGARSDVTVTVGDPTGLAEGDIIVVEDNYNFGRETIDGVNSHLARVMDVTGNVVTINNPLPTAFPTATSLVRKVTLVENATVKVKTIAGAPYQGVAFKWARHCKVLDTEVNPIGKDAVYFHSAFGNIATNINGRNPISTVSPLGYGCMFDFGASDNILENSYFEGIREISFAEYSRRNTVKNCSVINAADSAINTHGLSAEDSVIENNVIISPTQYGIAIGQITSGYGLDLRTVVRENTIINAGGWAIREVQFSDGSSVASDTIIENNLIRFGADDAIYIGGSNTASDVTNTIVRNNKIISSGANGIMIDTLSVNNATIQNNIIENTTDTGILFNAPGNNITCQGNIITSAGAYGIRNYAVGPRILISDNIINSATTADYLNIGLAMPTSGTWRIGDRMPYYGNGATPLNGWRRITTGSSNVLNTDWVAN